MTEELTVAFDRDVALASRVLTPDEARWLVDTYYQVQDYRIQASAQVRSSEGEEPNLFLRYVLDDLKRLEARIQSALDKYTDSLPVGVWLKGIYGIGPVIAAGLLAHLDVKKAQTVGGFWRFAGLDPTSTWNKGEKRPFNAKLKVLCWKAGQSFLKFSNRDECYYGKLYRERKTQEVAQNDAGALADQAAAALSGKRFKDAEYRGIYESGKLPPGHLDARARRWVVKVFLFHVFERMWQEEYGDSRPCPRPYVIEHLGHAHEIPPPQ
jgi:hypothetical protein